MDFDDTPELAAFRAQARVFLADTFPPREEGDHPGGLFLEVEDEAAHLAEARAAQRTLAEAGWAGLSWPEEFGGRGLTLLHEIVWAQEAARYRVPTGVFGIGIGMGGPTVLSWGAEAQKARWLPPMLSGEEIWCQLFSEPEAGSDVAAVRTRAERRDGGWVLNGQKAWTSGAHYSRWGMLLARTDPTVPKHHGLSYFILDMEQDGVEARPLRQMSGGANFNEVFLSDALVPDDGLLGAENQGWAVALTTLMNERASIGAMGGLATGSGIEALRRLAEQAGEVLGTAPLADPDHRERFVDAHVRARVLHFHSQRIISKLARGELPTAEGSIAKLGLTDLLERVAGLAVDLQGPHGALQGDDAPIDRRWSLLFLGYPGLRIAGGTDEIMRNVIGERVLGLPKEPRTDRDVPFRDL